MKSPKNLKNKAWRCFSKYIRVRDCLRTTGFTDQGQCVTCNKFFPISELQAGHAIGGRNNSILFDEKLVNAQCRICNGYGNGKYAEYSLWFIQQYGLEEWEKKIELSHKLAVDLDYQAIIDKYQNKLNKLLE